MKTVTRSTRTVAVICAATLAFLASGCSLLSGKNTPVTVTSGSPTAAATQDPAAPTTSAPDKKSAPAANTKTVTAPTTGLVFAIPEDWSSFTTNDLNSDQLAGAAKALGLTEDALRSQMQLLDLYAIAPLTDGQALANITVAKQAAPKGSPISEATLKLALSANGGEPGEYSKESVANGEAHLLSYTVTVNGEVLQGQLISAPTPSGDYAQLAITSTDADTRDKLKEIIISSLR
ncbi:Uncharacterised protein [Actinomyces bovis]|uniref:Lipoprotein n=1 Tax=Actinomyces bovis TaxID=1658 RepID=A0ABY1VPD7_9ACTO|nr:hypothetical protein [Actinomyces bovis]SPT53663.1 Uncharacterised protein [Actinomyces bovis]VEG55756.1 Uncharacterised protein [Actinomyces israelii]